MAGRIVRKRCVLLFGKTGAGKSTIANHLVGHDPMSPDDPPFKVSVNPFVSGWLEVQHQAVEFLWENNLYRVTVVDIPGLFNTGVDNDTIDDIIENYMDKHDVNPKKMLILLVVKKGVFTHEKDIFNRDNFESLNSALAITGCENDTREARKEIVQQFSHDPHTESIASQMSMGIYPVGFPPVKGLIPALQQVY